MVDDTINYLNGIIHKYNQIIKFVLINALLYQSGIFFIIVTTFLVTSNINT